MSHRTLLKWAAAAAIALSPLAAVAHSSLVETDTPALIGKSVVGKPLVAKTHAKLTASHHRARTLVKHTRKLTAKRHTRKPAVATALTAHKHRVTHLKSKRRLDKSARTGSTM